MADLRPTEDLATSRLTRGLIAAVRVMVGLLWILRTPNEWFWAYFLMIAAHVVLFAVAAGRAFGVDGVLRPLWQRNDALPARALVVAS